MKKEYEIVIIEDNPEDAELMIHSLKKNQLLKPGKGTTFYFNLNNDDKD